MAFTHTWNGPNGKKVVSAVVTLNGGTRSIVGVYMTNFVPNAQQVRQGIWKLVKPESAAAGPNASDPTMVASNFDHFMSTGDVVYYLAGNTSPYPQGWWMRSPQGASQNDMQAFAWGVQALAGNVQNAADATGVPLVPDAAPNGPGGSVNIDAQGPTPAQQPTPAVAVPVPVVVAPRRWPWVVGLMAAAGLVYVIAE
jgi:hypothetical protein